MLLDITSVAAAAALVATFLASRLAGRRVRGLVARQEERLAHTVHELRTPLTSVLTVFEMLRGGYATTAAERAEFLDEGELAGRHLAFLVDDMLDGAALAAGHLSLTIGEHRVAHVVADAVRLLGTVARHRDVTLAAAVPGDLAVRADSRRLLQVLFNLIGNALKFSPPGTRVEIGAAASGEAVRVHVADEGPGVPETLRERLFTPFGREHRGGPAGTGLGLHITKGLITHMRGTIGYEPGAVRGSVFWFELPRAGARDVVGKAAALAR